MNEYFTLDYWKNFFNSPTKKRLAENFASLSILQALNYLLPLITLPYLVRVLGPEKYGLISFAQAFIGYFAILVDYGFGLSATREISINREKKEKVSEIFSSVMAVKFILGAISFIILGLFLIFIPKFGKDWLVYIFAFGTVLGNILFPVWFFLGMEKMKYITVLNVIARGIFTICIFIFIKKVADYFYVPLLYSLGYVVAGGLSLGIVFKDFGVKFTLPTLTAIRHQLKEGWHFFVTIISVNLRTTSNAFILGLLTNNTIVGYYSGAEKLIRAAIGVFDPITVTVYPHISQLMDKSKEAGLKFVKKLIFLIGGIGFSLSAISFFFAPFIVKIILGPQYQPSILVLQILSIIPFIAGIAGVLGSQTMVTLNYKKQFARIHFSAAALNLLLIFFLVLLYKQAGAAMAWVITDIFVVILMTIFLWRKRINILNFKFNFSIKCQK